MDPAQGEPKTSQGQSTPVDGRWSTEATGSSEPWLWVATLQEASLSVKHLLRAEPLSQSHPGEVHAKDNQLHATECP